MQPGLLVAPSLKLVRPLGKGGMGTVWVAHHAALGREVAVKFLSEELAHDLYAVARFEREASAVAELQNEHIVGVIEYGFTEWGLPYMATELLEGEDLGDRLARERRLDPEIVAQIIDQLCEALGAAHELGIVHRDIKPENVFVLKGDALSVRLLDFGIAKHWQDPKLDVTSTGVVVGTPHYMSPEQFLSSKHVDYRADLWSLGVLAYRALTGRLPFEATSFAALCIQIHRGVFPRATAYRAELPPSLNGWFTKALRGHPAARFASPAQMAESFRAALSGTSPVSVHPSAERKVTPPDWARGHPGLVLPDGLSSSDGGDAQTIELAIEDDPGKSPTGEEPNEAVEPLPDDPSIEVVDSMPVRRRSRLLPALLLSAISMGAAWLVQPLLRGTPEARAEHEREKVTQSERRFAPDEPKVLAPEPIAWEELPPVLIVSGRAPSPPAPANANTRAPADAKKVAASVPQPPKEPDRGF